MSDDKATTSTPAAASGGGAKEKWGHDQNIKLLFAVLEATNPDLSVQGWDAVASKLQKTIGNDYSKSAAKHQWQKLRNQWMADSPRSENGEGPTALKAPKKRAAAGSGAKTKSPAKPKAKKTEPEVDDDATEDAGEVSKPAKRAKIEEDSEA